MFFVVEGISGVAFGEVFEIFEGRWLGVYGGL